jgi:hypothetical protein
MKKCVKWTGLTVAVLCVVLFNGIPANAQAQNPCAEDVAKFCKDVKPGEGRIARCLKDNSDWTFRSDRQPAQRAPSLK